MELGATTAGRRAAARGSHRPGRRRLSCTKTLNNGRICRCKGREHSPWTEIEAKERASKDVNGERYRND